MWRKRRDGGSHCSPTTPPPRRSHYCCRIEPNQRRKRKKSMMRKLALRGRVKGVGGITQQIGEKVRAERERGSGNVCTVRDRQSAGGMESGRSKKREVKWAERRSGSRSQYNYQLSSRGISLTAIAQPYFTWIISGRGKEKSFDGAGLAYDMAYESA